MVVFTCQHCGEPVKKPAVEKHYSSTKCRWNDPYLTCVDCLKDFSRETYGSHNQCMTEEQRYSAQGTVFKEQKGKKKQEKYVEMIQKILNAEDSSLSEVQRELLEVCSKFDNVPRKPKPFENFIKNVARSYKEKDVNAVFNIIDNAWKKATETPSPLSKQKNDQGKETTDLQERALSNEELQKNTLKGSDNDKTKSNMIKKSKKKKHSENPTTFNNGKEEIKNDENNIKHKKNKNEAQYDKLYQKDKSDQNSESLSESIKEDTDDLLNKESKSAKKEKGKRKTLCYDNGDISNPELENGRECVTDLKDGTVNDTQENVTKLTKKQLKKQKKYEKYLAELENDAEFIANENSCNKEYEESNDSKKIKKKSNKLKENKNKSDNLEITEVRHDLKKNNLTINADYKQIKKRKLEEPVDEIPGKKIKENSEEVEAVAAFSWADVIVKVLSSRPDKELSLKKLGKKVVNEYQAVKQDHRTYEELLHKFNKKVTKTKGVRVLRDRAKLIE